MPKAAPAMTSRGKWTPATTRDKAVRTADTAAISGISAEPEESAGNQKCAGSMSAGEGASVLVLYQRDKMKELRRTGTIELFTNQGDQQKAGSGDCPKGGNPQTDLFLYKGRQRTDRAMPYKKTNSTGSRRKQAVKHFWRAGVRAAQPHSDWYCFSFISGPPRS